MINFVNNPAFRDDIYQNDVTGWDLKSPTPVFKSILKERKFLKSGKLLILGSGYGYDAIEAVKQGFSVTAVDFSTYAIDTAKRNTEKNKVKIDFIAQDFFKLSVNYASYFDGVYDYVTYCAIDPDRREEYAKLVTELMKCGGVFIVLWFPVEERKGGPPFGINIEETEKIFSNYLKLELTLTREDTLKPRKGREILQIYRKEC